MKVRILITLLMISSVLASAQIAASGFYIGWSGMVPLNKEFISETSTQGLGLGYARFFNERLGLGFDAGYSILNDYVPLTTYPYLGGAITTDIYQYMYYYSALLNGQYYFKPSGQLIPFAKLGAGAAFTEYREYFNVYNDSDNRAGFLVRPEMGIYYRVRPHSSVGFKASLYFDYATNASEYFDLKNYYGLGFKLAAVLFND
jgi:hypothetical protein